MSASDIVFWIGIGGMVLSAVGLWLDRRLDARRAAHEALTDEPY